MNAAELRAWRARWKARGQKCAACDRPALNLSRWCRFHLNRLLKWGSIRQGPKLTDTRYARRRRLDELARVLSIEEARGHPVIGQALRQIALWLSAARDQHSRVGGDLDRLPPRLRAWTRTRLSHRTPADILARVLLTDDPECVSFDREQRDARACAVSFVLRQAGRSKGPPVGLYLARGARPMGRRILRALGPVLQLFRLMNAEQTVRRQLPPERRPQHALSPVPRPVKRWSHLLRAYLVTDDGDAY